MNRRVGFGEEGDAPSPGPRKIRRVPIVFLSLWLILWTGGIFYVASALIGGHAPSNGVAMMMIAWLVVAIIGGLFAVRALLRLMRGEPIGRGQTALPPDHPSRLPHDPDDR